MDKRGGGSIKIFRREFFVSQCQKTSWGNPSVFQKISGMEKNMDKKRGVYDDFPSKIFSLTVPKNFVGEPFGVSENLGYRKILWIRRGGGGSVTIFHRKFVSQYRKTS